jgi:hypothetical protein
MICIVLAVILFGAFVKMNNDASEINSDALYINSQNSQITNLQEQVDNLTNIVHLSQSSNWLSNQPISLSGSGYTSWTHSASYAGYIFVMVQTNNVISGMYIRVIYHSSFVDYDNQIGNSTYTTNVGSFPIMPSTNIKIIVGTNNPNGITGNVSITYYY